MDEYNAKFLRLKKRNKLSESENQQKALQAEERNLLTIMHDSSSLMSECKKTLEVPLMVVKGKVENRDSVGVQIPMEVQTLLDEFNDAILEDLPTDLPPMHNI